MDLINLNITPELLKIIAQLDEFNGDWKVKNNLNPDFLTLLVFEGFVDFFALFDLSKNSKNITELKSSVVILNSASLKKHLLKSRLKEKWG
ncbi:hypothetical protein [uncultured Gammaproteobacteria bacterium]|nr:hypothetical protein [uncultured Gammaproteobacteria bacterium]